MQSFFNGISYLIQGFKLLNKPGIRPFVIVPFGINLILFSSLIYFLSQYFSAWLEQLLTSLPDWLSFVYWIVMPAFIFILLFSSAYVFSLVANLIASPFNGLLAEKVEIYLTGVSPGEQQDSDWASILKTVPHSVGREWAKFKYYIPRVAGLAVLTIIPIVSIVAPIAWFIWGAWMMTIQYLDYPMDNHQISFAELSHAVAEQRLSSLGFGSAVVFLLSIPVINFLLMPAAVAGATIMWVEKHQK